ncbi:hypothetical protein, partial [Anaerovibrio sp.]|uniref:hypothetical protein n=1 Tax=Anaerovibrio sp. TaxID=1872532 RepID=UPI00388FDA7D
VKHINAESTWLETAWEDRKLPVRKELFLMRWLFFIVYPGRLGVYVRRRLKTPAVNVSCSTTLRRTFSHGTY